MTFAEKIKTAVFWKHVLRVSLLFFVLLVLISLLINSFSDILKFDTEAVYTKNFADGNWIRFFSTKLIISLVYGMWIINRNMN
ncbi:MAG: hypothetical protein QNJ57_08815 [Flavobacteriaceae bacterium]|nr:hypothetical protein [Flavobacteriaceae bacterium]